MSSDDKAKGVTRILSLRVLSAQAKGHYIFESFFQLVLLKKISERIKFQRLCLQSTLQSLNKNITREDVLVRIAKC